jgi:hypothetical protein
MKANMTGEQWATGSSNISCVVIGKHVFFNSGGQPDDDHIWSKHVADMRTKFIVVFWLDLFCIFEKILWCCNCHATLKELRSM